MKYNIFLLFGICNIFSHCFCEIEKCDQNKTTQLCSVNNSYIRSEFPEPSPCEVNITIHLKEIYKIDENMNTLSLFIRLTTVWEDKRLTLIRSERDEKRYNLKSGFYQSKAVEFYSQTFSNF